MKASIHSLRKATERKTKWTQGIGHGVKTSLRLMETSKILSFTAIQWVLGDRPPPPQLLRELFEKLGTTYIKLGQFIASSPSLFPEAYVEEFQHCLDNTPPLPFQRIYQVIKLSLQTSPNRLFQHIDPVPLASASIAQVHAATLLDGTEVVIKVQKPGIRDRILTDLNFLYAAAKILEWLAPHLSMASLSDIVDEIQKSMLLECDFYQEAKNIEEFRLFLADNRIEGVTAPQVHEALSTDKVLTMERLHGVPFTDLEAVRSKTDTPQNSLLNAMNTWVSCLMQGHPFHADIHAGNLLVLEAGVVAFIDFGIVSHIRPAIWQAIARFIQAIYTDDFSQMAQAMMDIGITKNNVDQAALAQDIATLYHTLDNLNPNQGDILQEGQIHQLMMQLVSLGKQHGIHFPREFALLMKQILYFDRYLQLLAPSMDMLDEEKLDLLSYLKLPSTVH